MIRPREGLLCRHDMVPVELLCFIRSAEDGAEVWLVRPLFVDCPANRTELFREGDVLTEVSTR